MKNKNYIYLAIAILVAAVSFSTYRFLEEKGTTEPAPIETPPEEEIAGSVILSTKLGDDLVNPMIDIVIKPKDEPLVVTAFALSLYLETEEEPLLGGEEIIINSDLANAGWVYPLKKPLSINGNKIYFGLSGYFVGKTKYLFEDEVIIASIPIKEASLADNIKIDVDIDNSKILAENAVSEIEILTENDQEDN